jgi:phosphoglycolate phosphatase
MENIVEKFSLMNNNSYILIVAEENGMIIGTVMGIICLTMVANLNSFLVIEVVVIDKKYRGNGIGKVMLLELKNRVKRQGCSYIILVSGEQRKEAHKFYEVLGYDEGKSKGFRKFIDGQTSI